MLFLIPGEALQQADGVDRAVVTGVLLLRKRHHHLKVCVGQEPWPVRTSPMLHRGGPLVWRAWCGTLDLPGTPRRLTVLNQWTIECLDYGLQSPMAEDGIGRERIKISTDRA